MKFQTMFNDLLKMHEQKGEASWNYLRILGFLIPGNVHDWQSIHAHAGVYG